MNIQNKESTELVFKTLVQILKESNAPKDIQIVKESEYQFKINDQIKEYSERRSLTASRRLKREEYQFYQQFNDMKKKFLEGLDEVVKKTYENLRNFDFDISYNKGDTFQTVTGIEELKFDGDKLPTEASFTPALGVVTLLDFWATWCGPCQEPMKHNEDMLKKHEEDWKGKVQIIGLSVDNNTESVMKRVEEQDWKRVKHYRFKVGWDKENDAIKQFKIRGIPFVALLDKNGKINYMGHPNNCKLEEEIEKLVQENVSVSVDDQQQLIEEKQGHVEVQQAPELVKAFKDGRNLLRTSWKETAEKLQTYKGYYNISLAKTCKFKSDGTKSSSEKSKAKISYRIHITQKEQVEALNQLVTATIPIEFINYSEQNLDDPDQDFKTHLKFLYDLAGKYNLPLELLETEDTTIIYNFQTKSFEKMVQTKISQRKSFPPEQFKHSKETRKELKEYLNQNKDKNIGKLEEIFSEGLLFQIDLGRKFQKIENTHKFGKKEETLTIEHQDGQVLIIDFWAFWCGPCIKGMIQNSKLFKQNKEKWNDKVRIVAVSLESEDESKKLLDSQPEWLEALEIHFLKDGRDNLALFIYGVKFIPHIVVVGKDGVIRSIGNCENLEEVIDKLLIEEGGYCSNKDERVELNYEQGKQLADLLNDENFTKVFEEKLRSVEELVYLKLKFEVTQLYLLTPDSKTFLKSYQPTLNYCVRENYKDLLDDSLSKLYAVVPKEKIKVGEVISKVVDIPFPGQECELCKAGLNDQTPQYYNHFNGKFYCTTCAEADDKEKVGNARFKVTDTLAFINAPLKSLTSLKEIDEYKFGKNLKIKDGEEGSQNHEGTCLGCGSNGVTGPRFIALNSCFFEIKSRAGDKYNEIVKKYSSQEINEDTIYLRILFSHNYFEY